MITQNSIDEFLARLASADATPGGGSAAAIMGAMGAALVSMVCNVSIGKKGLRSSRCRDAGSAHAIGDVAPALDCNGGGGRRRVRQLDGRLQAVERGKAQRVAAIQASLRRASEHGYRGVISDGGVGALAAYSAARSAALNVCINAPALKDRHFAEASIAELEKLLESCAEESEAAYVIVRKNVGP